VPSCSSAGWFADVVLRYASSAACRTNASVCGGRGFAGTDGGRRRADRGVHHGAQCPAPRAARRRLQCSRIGGSDWWISRPLRNGERVWLSLAFRRAGRGPLARHNEGFRRTQADRHEFWLERFQRMQRPAPRRTSRSGSPSTAAEAPAANPRRRALWPPACERQQGVRASLNRSRAGAT